jgi:hypothetical protein
MAQRQARPGDGQCGAAHHFLQGEIKIQAYLHGHFVVLGWGDESRGGGGAPHNIMVLPWLHR